jgi:hypothetical protein
MEDMAQAGFEPLYRGADEPPRLNRRRVRSDRGTRSKGLGAGDAMPAPEPALLGIAFVAAVDPITHKVAA